MVRRECNGSLRRDHEIRWSPQALDVGHVFVIRKFCMLFNLIRAKGRKAFGVSEQPVKLTVCLSTTRGYIWHKGWETLQQSINGPQRQCLPPLFGERPPSYYNRFNNGEEILTQIQSLGAGL